MKAMPAILINCIFIYKDRKIQNNDNTDTAKCNNGVVIIE